MALKQTRKKQKHSEKDTRIQWHPAFFEAIKMELNEYSHALQFTYQHQLTSGPLQIDVVIIKKTADIPIKKNIAAIFQKVNILEYKSPDIYLSVMDFYKVYAYACLYLTLNEDIDISDLTLSFVESHYPGKLIKYLKEKRNFLVEETRPGIYSVKGDILPIQIIDSSQLSVDENIWLKDLSNALDPLQLQRLAEEVMRLDKAAQVEAYLKAIMQANPKSLEEMFTMSESALTLDDVLERVGAKVGAVARWEARGEEKKAAEIARNMLKNGFPVEQIAELSGLEIERIKELDSLSGFLCD